jgi:7-cyano-7-deazaguanine synthase
MKTILIYSGGLDSTVLLYDLMNKGGHVLALSFNYGQRHRLEVDYAKQNCLDLGIPHRMADLRPIKNLIFDSSQTSHDIDVPEGHYTEESMKATGT